MTRPVPTSIKGIDESADYIIAIDIVLENCIIELDRLDNPRCVRRAK